MSVNIKWINRLGVEICNNKVSVYLALKVLHAILFKQTWIASNLFGQLSEEATYKDFKKYRNTNIRMFSREAVNEHQVQCHAIPLDPLITSCTVMQSHQIPSLPAHLSRSPIISSHYQLSCHVVSSDPVITN